MGEVVGCVLFAIARDGHDSANVLFFIVGAVLVMLGISSWRNPADPRDARGGFAPGRISLNALDAARGRRYLPIAGIVLGLLLVTWIGIGVLAHQDLFSSDAPTGRTVTIGVTTSSPTARP